MTLLIDIISFFAGVCVAMLALRSARIRQVRLAHLKQNPGASLVIIEHIIGDIGEVPPSYASLLSKFSKQ